MVLQQRLNYTGTLRTRATETHYLFLIKRYAAYRKTFDLDEIIAQDSTNIKLTAARIREFLLSITSSLSPGSMHNYKAALKHFYEMNDISLNWRKINRFAKMEDDNNGIRQKDRAYTYEEIQKMLYHSNEKVRAIIRQYVLDCSIKRMTSQETAEYLKQKGLPVDGRTVKRYRARIKESAQNWVAKLAKSKRAAYIALYKETIDEVQLYKQELWKIMDDGKVDAHTKIEAIGKLLNCTGQLVQLYDCIPLINAIQDYGCGYDHNKDMLQQDQYHPADESNIDSLA